jgi:hypothetical protein
MNLDELTACTTPARRCCMPGGLALRRRIACALAGWREYRHLRYRLIERQVVGTHGCSH